MNLKLVNEEIIFDILTLLKGKATPEQEAKIHRWLQAGEENRIFFEQVSRDFYTLRYAKQWDKIDTGNALKQVQSSLRRQAHKKRIRIYRLTGIAALLILLLGTTLFFSRKKADSPLPLAVVEEVKAGGKKALLTLADGKTVELNTGEKVNVDLGFAQAVEDSAGGLAYRFNTETPVPLEYHTLTVPRAGEYIMTLSDGSRVWLNAESQMRYPVNFEAGKREIYLSGEAYFEVVKETERPFIVITPNTRTTVLGTSFNVMAYSKDSETEITLVSGAVAVKAGQKECRIMPGQQVAVNNSSLEMKHRTVNVSFYTSWKNGLFDFDHMTLSELCVKLSRWYDVDFSFKDPETAGIRFTGAVKRNKDLQFMLDFIQKTSGVNFEIRGKTVIVCNR